MATQLTQDTYQSKGKEPEVLVSPPPRITEILVPFDFGGPAARALAYARALAEGMGASIELLHVVPHPHLAFLPVGPDEGGVYHFPPPSFVNEIVKRGETELDRALSTIDPEVPRTRRKVAVGDPCAQILAFAGLKGVDLIVMGTQDREGLSRAMLGSVAEVVVREAMCPVLIVR